MSFIIGMNNDSYQGIQIQHDSKHNGYLGIKQQSEDSSVSSTSFSIDSSELETIITSSDLLLKTRSVTIPSLVHDDDTDRILVVTKDGRIRSSYNSSSSTTLSTTLLWVVMFGITLYKVT